MTRNFSASDTKPWYRQFWPWFIMALPATVVVAGFITMYIAFKHSDDLVVDEYYKDGLAINQQLEKKRLAEQLDISATLQFVQSEFRHTVVVWIGGDYREGDLNLSLSHPLEADRDFVVSLQQLEPGVYGGAFDNTIATRWHWILDFVGSNQWRLDGSIVDSDFSDESFQ
jgi:hypothetical protein